MKLFFLHGWHSIPGSVKPTYVKKHGHTVINPALDDDDFDAAVCTAHAEYDQYKPDVIVGSSRGSADAMSIVSRFLQRQKCQLARRSWLRLRSAMRLGMKSGEVLGIALGERLDTLWGDPNWKL